MMKVEFLEDAITLDGEGNIRKSKSFKRGQVVELEGPSARFWIDRNKARLFLGKSEPGAKRRGRPPSKPASSSDQAPASDKEMSTTAEEKPAS